MDWQSALTTNIDSGQVALYTAAGAVIGGTLGIAVEVVMASTAVAEVTTTVGAVACADGDCTNEAQSASRVVNSACADGDCTNEIRTGANAVYRLVEEGETRYIGITNDFARRAGEHQARGWTIEPIPGLGNLSRFDAHAVEQVLIERYKLENLYNKINSIASSNHIYEEAIARGSEILTQIGYLIPE